MTCLTDAPPTETLGKARNTLCDSAVSSGRMGKDVESGGEGCVDGAVAHHMHPWKTWEMREASIWVLVWVYFCDIGHSDSEEMEPISLQA